MAEVAVTIRGQLYDLYNRTTQQVVLQGQASLTGLTVGGGPIYPEAPGEVPPGGGGTPPGFWGGGPHPMPPYVPPGWGGGGTPPGTDEPHPEHPIVKPPDPPTEPPVDPPTQPADPQWVWGFSPKYGWHPVYVPNPDLGQPGPKH